MSQSTPPPPPPSGAAPRKPDAKKKPPGKRSYTLNLGFSMLMTMLIVTILGACWIFMLGVMVGRGYNPDAKIAEVVPGIAPGSRLPAAPEPATTALRPEELDFIPALRNKPRLSVQHNAGLPVNSPGAGNRTAPLSTLPNPPEIQTAGATGQIAAPPSPPPPAAPKAELYDYVYQTATFNDPEQADKLREKLEGVGVRTRLEKTPAKSGKILYKVQALLRGNEEDNKDLLASLERFRLGPPLLRSKTPAKGDRR